MNNVSMCQVTVSRFYSMSASPLRRLGADLSGPLDDGEPRPLWAPDPKTMPDRMLDTMSNVRHSSNAHSMSDGMPNKMSDRLSECTCNVKIYIYIYPV